MLMMIGPLRLEVAPFNATEYAHQHGAQYVEKPVMGVRPPLEWTGDTAETWSIRANLFPEAFGGESALTVLALMRKAGAPQYMLRGDGGMMGWVVLESVSERSSFLGRNGVGKMIEVDIAMRRSQAPTPVGYYQAMAGLFGGLF